MSRTSAATNQHKPEPSSGTVSRRGVSIRRKRSGNAMERSQMIAVAAYFRAERRGFNGGDPVEDWLAAEAEIDQLYH